MVHRRLHRALHKAAGAAEAARGRTERVSAREAPPKQVWARDRGEWEDPARSEATERRAAPEPDARAAAFRETSGSSYAFP